MIIRILLLTFLAALLSTCTRPVLGFAGMFDFLRFQDPEDRISLKGVHLDGPGLLNHEVLVNGQVKLVGKFETFVVIEEEKVRMLVDLSRLGVAKPLHDLKPGKSVEVAGKVQAGENGHVYLVATAIKPG